MTERKLHILVAGGDANEFVLLNNELNKAFRNPVILYSQDAAKAVSICATVNFDVLIAAIDFLQTTEKELFKNILQVKNAPAVIFLTEFYNEDFSLEAILFGAQDCLPKADLNSHVLYKSITFAVARKLSKTEIPTTDLYQKLFLHQPLPVVIYAVDNKDILLANQAAAQFYGYNLPEFAALNLFDLQPENGNSSKNFTGQKKHRTKNGDLILVEVRTNLIKINQKTCRQMVVIDQSKKAFYPPETRGNEMQQQLLLLQSAISKSSDGVMISKNVSGSFCSSEIVYSNQAFNHLTGFSSAEISTQTPEHLHKKYPVKEASAQLQPEIFQTRFINYQNNREFWVDYSVSSVTDAGGNITHFVAVYRDVSARKNAETETEILIRNLEETNQELKQFSYVISHNLRAPLANLTGLLSLLDVETIQDADTLELIDAVKSSTEKLNITVNDIIDVLLIRSEDSREAEVLPLQPAWEKAKNALSYLVESASAQFIVDFEEAPTVAFRENYLDSILVNFLSNALKYRSDDRQLIINLKTYEEANFTVLVFEDNGIGIDMNRYGSQVFGLYKRFSNKAEGKGLGLYIVQAQVEAMGGKIEVKSELNKGTRFTVFFKK